MDTLFGAVENEGAASAANQTDAHAPLADRVRPATLVEVIGQEHLLGENGPLRAFFASGNFPSILFWGPPGVGKTTLALLIAHASDSRFTRLSAVEAGVKEVREVIKNAEVQRRHKRKTLLFIDEIHRFNKSQQDALLHAVEKGIITLIGATTENPSFEVNAALLSRCQVYRLRSLDDSDIRAVLEHALAHDAKLQTDKVRIRDWDVLLQIAGGDARSALNALEMSAALARPDPEGYKIINRAILERALQRKTARYDKKGDSHYDTISAFIKSMRGSDPDAALLWLAKMIDAGEDPVFIARRMVIFASEDIGNADPGALAMAVHVFEAVRLIGMPEASLNLAQGVCYLAGAPKSNASYTAIGKAMDYVRKGGNTTVPLHLRNAPTALMKQEGYGAEYKYPHDFPDHFVAEHYFPEGVAARTFYRPGDFGKEAEFGSILRKRWAGRYGDEGYTE